MDEKELLNKLHTMLNKDTLSKSFSSFTSSLLISYLSQDKDIEKWLNNNDKH